MKRVSTKKVNSFLLWLPILGGIIATCFVFYSEYQNEKNYLNLRLHREIDQILRKDLIETKITKEFKLSIYYTNKALEVELFHNPLELSKETITKLLSHTTNAAIKYYGPYTYLSKTTPTRQVLIIMTKGDFRLEVMRNLRVTYIVFLLMLILCTLNTRNIKTLRYQNDELSKESKKLSFAQATAKLGTWEFITHKQEFIWGEQTFLIFDMDPDSDIEPSVNDFFAMATNESRTKIKDAYETVLTKGASLQTEISIITPIGNKKFLLNRAEALLSSNGKVERIFGTSIDITEKKKLEEEIAIERQKKQEDNRMAAIGELSSNIAHEITTPMTVIAGQASLMKMKLQNEELNRELLIERCEKIEETVRRMGHIITSLRILSRRSQFDEFEPTLIKDIFQSVLYFVIPRLRDNKIDFKIAPYNDKSLAVMAKPVEISQVLLNLINNAIDAIMDNKEKWLKIEVNEEAETVQLKITDSGKIPLEIKERIFKDSFTTKPIGKGTGIGLTVSKRIIEAHKGEIQYLKEEPTTTFQITLPKAEIPDV